MPKVAHAEPGATLIYGEHTFQFDDGTRQVSEEEAEILRQYEMNGGPLKVEVTEEQPKKGKE